MIQLQYLLSWYNSKSINLPLSNKKFRKSLCVILLLKFWLRKGFDKHMSAFKFQNRIGAFWRSIVSAWGRRCGGEKMKSKRRSVKIKAKHRHRRNVMSYRFTSLLFVSRHFFLFLVISFCFTSFLFVSHHFFTLSFCLHFLQFRLQ